MKENVYFDNAATTWPKPEPVYAFMDSFFRSSGVNPGRGGHAMIAEAEAMTHATRRMLAAFFGFNGDVNRVVFTLNGTDSLNTAIAGLVHAGDHIVTSRIEHNAVLRVTNHLERDNAIQVTRVSADRSGCIDVSEIAQAIQPNTKAIVINHASNVIGRIQSLEAIAEIASNNQVALIVDSAQSAGVVPIDMQSMGIDILTFTGHKGLFGPMGIGGLIVSDSIELNTVRFGGTGVDSIGTYHPITYPHRLEAGTLPLPGIAGLHAAQKWFADMGAKLNDNPNNVADQQSHQTNCKKAIEQIHEIEMTHMNQIESWLRSNSKVSVLGDASPKDRVANMSFTFDGMSAEQISDMLDAHVDASTVERGGAVRISPGYFTDEEDMTRLKAALDDVLSH